jgi:hypothetical protein
LPRVNAFQRAPTQEYRTDQANNVC